MTDQTHNTHHSTDSRPSYLIVGAAGGIGSSLARRLAGAANLTLAGRTASSIRDLALELDANWTQTDATDFEQLEAAVSGHVEIFGGLDGVVNCAGSILLKPAHLTSSAEFEETIGANLVTAFNVVKAAARPMMKAGSGSIVLVSSAAAQHGLPNHEAVAAAKAGVIGLARSAAATYANRNVRVNCVALGLVETPLTERITSNPKGLEQSVAMHALGRIGAADDAASAIGWLLDSRSSGWVTGQVLGVDGGLGSLMPRLKA